MVDSGMLFAVIDQEGALHSWNKAFETFFNVTKKRSVLFHSLFHETCHKKIKNCLRFALDEKRVKSFFIQSHCNSYTVRFEPLSDSSSDVRSIAVYIDFAEKAYSRCATDVLETIIDSTPDPILLFDSKGKILRANLPFLEAMMIQGDRDNLVGKHVMDIFPPEYRDSRRAHVEYVLNEKKLLCAEVEFAGKTGMAYLIPIFDENGEVELILVLTQDITHKYTLKHKEDIINSMASELDETNIAIKRVTKIMEKEQANLKAEIQNNINVNVKPLLRKLKNSPAADKKALLLLNAAIDNIVSDASGHIKAMHNVRLTLTENRVCQLIKNGHKIREIAEILNLADDTVKNHRKNIRKKLGLRNKDINLRSYLENCAHSGHAR